MTDAGLLIFADQAGRLFEAQNPSEPLVHFYPQGGGFRNTLPNEVFHRHFRPYLDAPKWRWAYITGDWMSHLPPIKAAVQDRTWNGWVKPALSLGGLIRNAQICEVSLEINFPHDHALIRDPDNGEVDMQIEARIIEVEGVQTKLWDFSGAGWCWELADPSTIWPDCDDPGPPAKS